MGVLYKERKSIVDGNVGQFNEDGFLGPVWTALKKGWNVELYTWEVGLSQRSR